MPPTTIDLPGSPHVPPGYAPPREAADPMDMGLDLADWEIADPTGYAAAVVAAADDMGDDMVEVLCELVRGRAQGGELRRRMEERLEREVLRGAKWVADWLSRFVDTSVI